MFSWFSEAKGSVAYAENDYIKFVRNKMLGRKGKWAMPRLVSVRTSTMHHPTRPNGASPHPAPQLQPLPLAWALHTGRPLCPVPCPVVLAPSTTHPVPVQAGPDVWQTDAEFGRQALAGQNPLIITALTSLEVSFALCAHHPSAARVPGGLPAVPGGCLQLLFCPPLLLQVSSRQACQDCPLRSALPT